MAVDDDQLIRDAECIVACMMPGMIEAAKLAAMAAPTVVAESVFVVSTNGVKILSANPKRRSAFIMNVSGVTTSFIGPSTVTTSGATQGYQLPGAAAPSNSPFGRIQVNTTGELYAAATGVNIRVLEFLTP